LEPDRHIHLVLENELNEARYLRRTERCQARCYTAQWNDDIHHALHVLITGEHDGYYADYAEQPISKLGRCLVEGFAFQGDPSPYRLGRIRGEPSTELPPTAFVSFLQNHDQIGNRAFGERITKLADPRAVRAASAILLLAPSPPMLFMGEEFEAGTPFLFFCDFEKQLAHAVTQGRRAEFAQFPQFADPSQRERIPDPSAISTFEASRLDWASLSQTPHKECLQHYRHLLKIRCRHIVPLIADPSDIESSYEVHDQYSLTARWIFAAHARLTLIVNLAPEECLINTPSNAEVIYSSRETVERLNHGRLSGLSVAWFLQS
jgi:malto-oligosyltrehalose trehalohydrolase